MFYKCIAIFTGLSKACGYVLSVTCRWHGSCCHVCVSIQLFWQNYYCIRGQASGF